MRTASLLILVAVLLSGCPERATPPDVAAMDDALDTTMDVIGPDSTDEGLPPDGGPAVGPRGGSVDRLRFAVFGDVRPPTEDDTASYPTAIVQDVMDGIEQVGAQFVIATGDYMFARSYEVAARQVDLLLAAESRYRGHVFHALGNHECTGATASNCPNATETGNVRVFRERLIAAQPGVYYDFVVQSAMGDAHFIVSAPNAWSSSQQAWLARVLAQPARYTFVVAHVPPTSNGAAPGSSAIEDMVRMRAGGVTLRLYGHTHDYRRIAANALISGNAGAPLQDAQGSYGFVLVEQRSDGNVQVTAYDVGRPPMVVESFVVRPDGTSVR